MNTQNIQITTGIVINYSYAHKKAIQRPTLVAKAPGASVPPLESWWLATLQQSCCSESVTKSVSQATHIHHVAMINSVVVYHLGKFSI